jgi:hypothetical protein
MQADALTLLGPLSSQAKYCRTFSAPMVKFTQPGAWEHRRDKGMGVVVGYRKPTGRKNE